MRHQPVPPLQVDEFSALELAGPEIDRLERYESRAWTRQLRAMRSFIEISRSIETPSQRRLDCLLDVPTAIHPVGTGYAHANRTLGREGGAHRIKNFEREPHAVL